MALVSIGGGGIYVPSYPLVSLFQTSAGYTSFLMDAATEKVAMAFTVPKTGTLAKVGFRLGIVTQAPVNGLKVSFQDFDLTTGNPDGAIDQFRVVSSGIASSAWILTGLVTSDGTDGGAKRSVTLGQRLYVVIEFESFVAADALNIVATSGSIRGLFMHNAYMNHFTAAWAKSQSNYPALYVEYDDGSTAEIMGALPISAIAAAFSFNNASTPDEYALKVTMPFKARCTGVWASGGPNAAGGDFALTLYDSIGGVLGSQAWDAEEASSTTLDGGSIGLFAPVVLDVGSVYYAAFKPTTAVAARIVTLFDVASANVMDAMSFGQNAYLATRTDAGAWTDTVTRRPPIGLILDQLDNAAGGLLTHPGMAGGARG